MCGIIGYVGTEDARVLLLGGLSRLEYRGYDSAGVAVTTPAGLRSAKIVGPVSGLDLSILPQATSGIGHTRWATHGEPTMRNAHPHLDCTGDFAVVHNGIIENHAALRGALESRGHRFASDTDTEVIAHLVEEAFEGDLPRAVAAALSQVRGSYAIVVLSNRDADRLVAARHKSPLLVGVARHGHIVASDATAVLDQTSDLVYLLDGDVASVRPSGIEIFASGGKPRAFEIERAEWSVERVGKGDFEHYMMKEIHEIPSALADALRGRVDLIGGDVGITGNLASSELANAERVLILGCGTSYNAGLIGRHLIESLARVPVDVQLASEYRYSSLTPRDRTLVVCVSQSGETADTLEGLRRASARGLRTLAFTNVPGSTITREANGVLPLRAGPEVGVAATKTFVNTVAAFELFALHLAALRGQPPEPRLVDGLRALPRVARDVLAQGDLIAHVARDAMRDATHAFFLGRRIAHGLALEGALKLKEIAYVPAEGYAAGELKHGPLALLAPGVPVVACLPRDATSSAMLSNLMEVNARGARVLALVDENDKEARDVAAATLPLPSVDPEHFPVPAAVALHLIAYHVARARGCPIDRPRNLAKSVTVE